MEPSASEPGQSVHEPDQSENVVLLSPDGSPIGQAPKHLVHTGDTPYHLAFSCHIFDEDGRVLVTRRALSKASWPGVWTNSFCGHPAPGEALIDAVHRRADYELGATLDSVELLLPDFSYRAVDSSGIVEHELCPVFRATLASAQIQPRKSEVSQWEWADAAELRIATDAAPWAFSPWLVLQLGEVLAASTSGAASES